jgi:hypothetical protein
MPFLLHDPDALNWLKIVEIADQALYMAKHDGRDGWVGLFATEDTRFEGVNCWLMSEPKDAAIEAGMRLLRKDKQADLVEPAVSGCLRPGVLGAEPAGVET